MEKDVKKHEKDVAGAAKEYENRELLLKSIAYLFLTSILKILLV